MGSGEIQGQMWGARARDWANYAESTSYDIFNSVLKLLPINKGTSLLDIGCGAGAFCKLAADQGARISGFDASPQLLDIARERVPHGDFNAGDMEKLPYANGKFDVVTGLNSFQFAENKVNALREARRVAKNGAKVMMLVWGNPEECEATSVMRSIGSLMPEPPKTGSAQPPLFQKGVIESLSEEAGLSPDTSGEIICVWNIADQDTALRGILSAGLSTLAIRHSGEERVRNAVSEAIEPFRLANGSYKLKNKFRYVISTANHV